MKKFTLLTLVAALICLACLQAGCWEPSKRDAISIKRADHSSFKPSYPSAVYKKSVTESARDIPVAYDVDVVVVGGSTGGVVAAVEAARKGAKVFLAASRPYLGEDVCGTYRLWLEPGEEPRSPLAKKIYAEPTVVPSVGKGIAFTYKADKPSAGVHKDTPTPSLLTDGKWSSAPTQSVQYDGDVTITAELGREHGFQRVHVLVYQRDNDFEVESVTVSISDDLQEW